MSNNPGKGRQESKTIVFSYGADETWRHCINTNCVTTSSVITVVGCVSSLRSWCSKHHKGDRGPGMSPGLRRRGKSWLSHQ